MADEEINTEGGSVVEGNVKTGGGNFVGRDSTHNTTRHENTSHTNLSGNTFVTVLALLIVGAIAVLLIVRDRLPEPSTQSLTVAQSSSTPVPPTATDTPVLPSATKVELITITTSPTPTPRPVTTTTPYDVERYSVQTGAQILPGLDYVVQVVTVDLLRVQFDVTGTVTCSDIRLHILLDGREVHVTNFFGGESQILTTPLIDLSPVSPGLHTVTLRPEGKLGGCNVAGILSWAGVLFVDTNYYP